MSAELLKRAAEKLREHAAPIRPAYSAEDWCFEYAHFAIRHVERNVDLDINPCPDHGTDHGMFGRYSGRYVALMHPPVALALADWLEAFAGLLESDGGDVLLYGDADAAFALARAVLREKPCRAEYERPGGREREDRIVRCGRTEGHDGPHREFDGAPEWEAA